MKVQVNVLEYDSMWESDKPYKRPIELDTSTFDAIEEITKEKLLNHLKNGIGSVTPLESTKFLPRFEIGELELSMQLNYQLWCYRRERLANFHDEISNHPMEEREFAEIMGVTTEECYSSYFDFAAKLKGADDWVAQPGQISINGLLIWLRDISMKLELDGTGLYPYSNR